jgi:hypothetical protein
MRRVVRWLALVGALAGAGSCGNGTGPLAGVLIVSLATPNPGADGAVLLTVTGPSALTSVTPAAGLRVFSEPLGTSNSVAVTGPLANGAILTIGVLNVARVGDYVATLQGVAASDYTLRALTGYSLTISR